MNKLHLHTPDLTAANIDRIAALFPNCVTEAKDETGRLKRAIDFDLLKQELSPDLVEGPQERYRLDWPGKREALALANTPVALTLRPCRGESVDFETTKNLYIEGDNLDALKLLQETYLGKVKMIYIDPPYNTGNDFIYDDNFSMGRDEYEDRSGDRDEEGNAMFVAEKWKQNSSANGRFHSEWLSMIYPRLKLARNLLNDNGIIFVSIGQEEVANLLSVCNEVYGPENFVTVCSRVMKRGGQKGTHFSPCVDYILAFAKSISELNPFREEISQNLVDQVYTKVAKEGSRKGERYRSMGLYQAMLDKRANQRFYIECPDGALVIPPGTSFPVGKADGKQVTPGDGDGVWRWTYARFKEEKRLGNVEFIRSDRTSLVNPDGSQASWNVYYKIWLNDRLEAGQLPGNIIEKFESRHSSAELKTLEIPFDFAKPSALIKYLMAIAGVRSGEITLDFFSGSGSTAHAAIDYAVDLGADFPFICVQLPEPTGESSDERKQGYKTIAEIGKERIRRAGKKILQEWQAKQAKEQSAERDLLHPPSTISDPPSPPDIGFRVLKIDSSNFLDIERRPDDLDQKELALHTEHIKPDRTAEDLLFQVLVDWGVDLALPIVSETLHGKRVFFVDQNALAACFDTGLTDALIQEIASRKPLRAVFRDDGFGDDSTRINVEQIFKLLSPGTEIKSL